MVVWFGLTGLNLSRDAGSHRLALSAWSASRPVTTGALLWPKLLTGGALWLGAVLVILLGSAAVRGLTGRLQWPPAAIPLFLAASSLNLLVGILPLCLSGRIPGFPWSLAPLVLLYGLAATAWGWVGDHPQFHAAVFVLLVALVALKLMVTYGAFHRSLVLELVSPRFVAGCVGGWLVAAGGLTLAVVLLMLDAGKWDLSSLLALPIAVLIVPLARIALSPLALALNRHR
jgi:hypothetical protein